jgi:hypothetical protein
MIANPNEEYLGDGLYVSYDGFQIYLRAPRIGGDHFVAIEPLVFQELLNYVKKIGWTIEKEKFKL